MAKSFFLSMYKTFFSWMKNHCPPDDVPTAAPWLVFTHPGKEEEQLLYNLFERSPYNKIHQRNIPEMNPEWFRYFQSPSHQGWLTVYCHVNKHYPESWKLKYGDCFLLDPVSLKKIRLPSLHSWITIGHEVVVTGGLLSAPPTMHNNSVVFFLLTIITDPAGEFNIDDIIVFCRPGDEEWKTQMLPRYAVPVSMTCFQGKLHLLCKHSKNIHLIVFEKQVGSDDDEMSLSETIITAFPVVAQDTLIFSSCCKKMFLESRDELFFVVVDYHQFYQSTPHCYEDITGFQVFRMNFSSMILEKVKSLGDHVLFLGEWTTASYSAADLGLTRGRVYFTMPEDQTVYVFDIEDGTISLDRAFSDSTQPIVQAEWLAMSTSYIEGNSRVNRNEAVKVEAEPNVKTSLQGYHNNNKKKYEGGTKTIESSGTSWGSLDIDIIELIASYLHTVDYLHFRAVCKTHRSVASNVRNRTTQEISPHTTSLSPWLILHQNNEDCVYRFINPMHNDETYLINLSESLLNAAIHCSKGGWLLMSQSRRRNLLFFFNPFTRDKVRLPEIQDHWRDFEGISFSSTPTSADCKVFAIGRPNCGKILTSFISRGDKFWCFDQYGNTKAYTSEEEDLMFNLCRTNPVFHDGRFYCMGTRGNLGVFEMHNTEHSWKVLDNLSPACTSYRQSFLVECDGQLLSVFVTPLNKTRPVQIFKLHASEKTKELTWIEVEDLGKHMLFVSHTCCIATIAPVSRMKNKIYFPRLHNNRIVFFSLDTCRYHTLFLSDSTDQYSSSSDDFYSTKKHLYCTWIEPNWSRSTTIAAEFVW